MRIANFVIACSFVAVGCAAPVGDASEEPVASSEAALEAELTSAAPSLPTEVQAALSGGPLANEALDRLYTIDHYVPVGPGRRIHLTETFSLRAWLRWPHRTMLMLSGPIVDGDFYQIDADGYRGRDILARRGFFAVTADFEGTGKSTYPADGRSVTIERETEAMRKVVRYLQLVRLTPRVDLMGESWGGGVAAHLCADKLRVRSCTLASMLYLNPSTFAQMTFLSPDWKAMLDASPDGYLTTDFQLYLGIVGRSIPEVQTWTALNVPGKYTTGPLYAAFDLPFFDPTVARAPGLIVQGELDPNQDLDDTRQLARDYGSGAQLYVVPGAGHVPRVEPPPANTNYWSAILNFVDP